MVCKLEIEWYVSLKGYGWCMVCKLEEIEWYVSLKGEKGKYSRTIECVPYARVELLSRTHTHMSYKYVSFVTFVGLFCLGHLQDYT